MLLLVVSPLAAWPTKSASGTETIPTGLQIIPVDQAESLVLSPVHQTQESLKSSPSQGTTLPKPSEKVSTMPSQELNDLLAFLKSDDSKDLADLTELRATFKEIKALIDIQKAAQKDLEAEYLVKIAEKDAEIAQLKDDYRSLSSQYDKVVVTLAKEQDKKLPHNYHITLGMSAFRDSATGEIGYGADLVYRIAGPFTVLGGAQFFPEQGKDIIYKAGVGISF